MVFESDDKGDDSLSVLRVFFEFFKVKPVRETQSSVSLWEVCTLAFRSLMMEVTSRPQEAGGEESKEDAAYVATGHGEPKPFDNLPQVIGSRH